MKVLISESSVTGLVWRKQREEPAERVAPQRTFLIKMSNSLNDLVDKMVDLAAYDKEILGKGISKAESQILKELGFKPETHVLGLFHKRSKPMFGPEVRKTSFFVRDLRVADRDQAVLTDTLVNTGVISVFLEEVPGVAEGKTPKPRSTTLRSFKLLPDAFKHLKQIYTDQ
jgi:hypothetical protein